ncbi:ATP-NAD kinase family protein [Thalassotalea sediminis]|uniref:ATP-NAD kinase family protein n=1 Tax=Thalassotalea sediminis TaxID=1759089 RepID=UPI0025732387|nr:ATP-NAD kinase family protein [Thalassotalea sediminis]
MFKLGLIINPIAGIGGSVAFKGSDGHGVAEQAISLGAKPMANIRAEQALKVLLPYKDSIEVYTVKGDMGENLVESLGFHYCVIHQTESATTTFEDTECAAKKMCDTDVDLLLFAGGDGTARNISHQVGDHFPVLGIPAGCKIHSGVYAVTPTAAGRIVELMVTNQLVTLTEADVMDIDESLFREGVVKAKRYGEMQVPAELRYVQATKSGGKESDELVLQDIAAHVIDNMDSELFIIGSGSTTAYLMEELGLPNTLLGVDVVQEQQLLKSDVTESQLWNYVQENVGNVKLVITLIGGQGHIFGRGNQQLSPRIIRAVGKENIVIIATKSKLTALDSRPLIADTGDASLDHALSGFMPVVTGYNDQVYYPVSSPQ